ncbi:hypothetical protein MHK_004500 [Candidatus Magnetomorum sp. HK-1]|nr:hypothetical protein MHK_004500 [Candidatus Magnetomorum sp. HK-1]
MWIIADPQNNLQEAAQKGELIENNILNINRSLGKIIDYEYYPEPSSDDIQDNIKNFDIIHFAGHAVFHDIAQEEFNLSIEHEPSAKAYYYRDQVLKHLMKDERLSLPNIELSGLNNESWTKDDPITISGIVKDRQYVSKIMIAGKNYLLTSSKKHVSFHKKICLNQGKNDIEIIAQNLLGGKSTKTIIINVDRSGPIITIKKYDSTSGIQ